MESRRSTLQFVVATVILGSLGIFATQARLDARTIVFYRCLFGAIAMGIYCLFLGHFRAIPKQDFLLACGTGFLMLGNWVFFFEGILRVGVTVATIVYQVQPFIVLIAGAILFQERLGLPKVLLFLVALLGLILATGIKWNMIDPGSLLGVGFTLLGATLYAGVVLVGKGLKSVKPEIVTFIQCAVGVLTLSPELGTVSTGMPGMYSAPHARIVGFLADFREGMPMTGHAEDRRIHDVCGYFV